MDLTSLAAYLIGHKRALLKRVALVEDNDDTRQSLTSLLESMGLTVLPARDADEALRIAAEENPDAFVVDMDCPA